MADPLPNSELPSSPRPALARGRWYAILGGVALIGALVAVILIRPGSPPPANQPADMNTPVNNSTNNAALQRYPAVVIEDRDSDGLSDTEEQTHGTNPNLADSDGDELTDAEEVNVYQTNPIKQDSDGDGFPDGREVATGNNPNGPGPLLDLPNAIQSINSNANTNQ